MKPSLTAVAALTAFLVGVLVVVSLSQQGDADPEADAPKVSRLDHTAPRRTAPGAQASPTPTYYVSKTNCADSGRGTAARPFCSIQRGVERLRPGDMLLIRNGTYRELVEVQRSGTAEAPIVIRGESRSRVIVDGGCRRFPCRESLFRKVMERRGLDPDGITIQGHDYVTLRNLTVRNTLTNGIDADRTTGLTVDNVMVKRTGMSGINVYDSNKLTVRENRVAHSNLGVRTRRGLEAEEESITIVNTSDFEVASNRLRDSLKEGIDIKVGSRGGAVHHNLVARTCAVGIYVNEAHDVSVYHNRILSTGFYKVGSRVVRCSAIPGYGKSFGRYFGDGLLIAVGDLGDLSGGKLSNIRIYRNVVSGANLNCLQFWDELRESGEGAGEMTDNRVYNNVFYNCGGNSGVGSGIRLDDALGTLVANNIIALNDEAGITGNSLRRSTISHNLFYRTGRSAGSDSVFGNPLFVNPRGRDFRLQKGSPAIDAGTDVGLPSTGQAPDLGAYELERR